MQSHKAFKKGLVVTALFIASMSYTDEIDDLNFFTDQESKNYGLFEGMQSTFGQSMDQISGAFSSLSGFFYNDSALESDGEISESEISSELKNMPNEKEKIVLDSALKQIPMPEKLKEIKVTLLGRNAKRLGFGALALVTISAITYVLYKNGTLKKLADVMKKHSYITVSVASVVTLVSGYYAFKAYEPYMVTV